MKVHYDEDEWYPVYSLYKNKQWHDTPVEITDAEWADYNRVMDEFAVWQEKIEMLIARMKGGNG